MGTSVYLHSYPKTSVSAKVQKAWDNNKPISHLDYVYEEVEGRADKLEWSAKYGFCLEAVNLLTPKDANGAHDGDQEFSITKEQLIAFKANIEQLDVGGTLDERWTKLSLANLQTLIDTFDFDAKYLTLFTD
ncbi:hypothetical protein pEaSNUABM11_00262 [Erwinia phage pEa_SNUABM_11]|nr:hypothetical protein pEaSNUABM11_00262 [Erwinia phage pEa_SNUABM_11]